MVGGCEELVGHLGADWTSHHQGGDDGRVEEGKIDFEKKKKKKKKEGRGGGEGRASGRKEDTCV